MSYILATDRVALAIRQGKQTQDRRPIRPRHDWSMVEENADEIWPYYEPYVYAEPEPIPVPAPWQPGDLLYVREAHRVARDSDDVEIAVQYRADGEIRPLFDDVDHRHVTPRRKWRPNILMPRCVARTWVRVSRVWVERVRDISDADARAEGFTGFDPEPADEGGTVHHWQGRSSQPSPRAHFCNYWESLYPGSWERNDWVWCCEFEREEQG